MNWEKLCPNLSLTNENKIGSLQKIKSFTFQTWYNEWDIPLQGRRNGFQSGGTMEHWKGMSATMVGRQEKFMNSRHSRMAKIVTFWPWWQTAF